MLSFSVDAQAALAANPGSAQAGKSLEIARQLASRVNRVRNLGAEATDITQQTAAALLKGGAKGMPSVSVSLMRIALQRWVDVGMRVNSATLHRVKCGAEAVKLVLK